MRFRPACLTILPLLFCGIGTIQAETLDMPASGSSSASTLQMELPSRMMSMRQVESKFGSPRQKLAPVGDPPITRWVYDKYTVYFEHQYVIHTVINR